MEIHASNGSTISNAAGQANTQSWSTFGRRIDRMTTIIIVAILWMVLALAGGMLAGRIMKNCHEEETRT